MVGEDALVVGIDGGGTAVRVVVADLAGRIVAEARGGGINPNSGGEPGPVLRQVLADALDQSPAGTRDAVVGGVAGLAGYLTSPDVLETAAQSAWTEAGLSTQLRVVSDLVVAFWSGFSTGAAPRGRSGRVLIAGTGAVAAAIHGSEVGAVCDGYGYLLGDRGAGVWLGQQAVRAGLDGASGRGPKTMLTDLVLSGRSSAEVIADVYRKPPRDLGGYAPLIDRAVELGDEVATLIAAEAAEELFATASAVGDTPSDGAPLVLVGSIAAGANPVGVRLRELLDSRDVSYVFGGDGIAGAVALATAEARRG